MNVDNKDLRTTILRYFDIKGVERTYDELKSVFYNVEDNILSFILENMVSFGELELTDDYYSLTDKGFWIIHQNKGFGEHMQENQLSTEEGVDRYMQEMEDKFCKKEGFKDSSGKAHVEYPWDFLQAQMERIGQNKDRYPRNNWQKPIDINELKYALFRHVLEVMKDNYKDGTDLGHLEAIGVNAGLIWYQLKNNS